MQICLKYRCIFILEINFLVFKNIKAYCGYVSCSRGVLVQHVDWSSSGYKDVTPPEFNVRTVVNEYGGGAFTVDGDMVIFSNYKDQRLYLQSLTSGEVA